MPFLDEQSRCVASTHLWSGILLRSNTVPTVTVNCVRQSPQKYRPGRWLSPFRALLRSMPPQCGQMGPDGQRIASRCLRAALSSVNLGSVKAIVVLLCGCTLNPYSAFVKYIIAISSTARHAPCCAATCHLVV